MQARRLAFLAATGAFLLSACADDPTGTLSSSDPALARASARSSGAGAQRIAAQVEAHFRKSMLGTNARLAKAGAKVRVERVDLLLGPRAPLNVGTTVFANDRTHHMPYFWVANDPRRGDDPTHLSYFVDESYAFAQSPSGREYFGDYLIESFDPWTDLRCGSLDMVNVPDTGQEPFFLDPEGNIGWVADIMVLGFAPLPSPILGVTETYIWVNEDGSPSDSNGDGRIDTAFSAIFYNSEEVWTLGDPPSPDVIHLPSVAVHENGHSLGIGHFGKIFLTNSNGKLHFAPQAIMNAAYVFPQEELRGTDRASYCSNFASWP